MERQNVFDTARWKYTRHLMTEEDIHINDKRVAMTERMMEEVLINELDNMPANHTGCRLKLMNDIGQSPKCKACSETFKLCSLYHLLSSMYFLTTIIYRLPSIYHLCIIYLSSNYVSINFHQGRIKRSACNTY